MSYLFAIVVSLMVCLAGITIIHFVFFEAKNVFLERRS